jgi:predicted nucleotidyltransferase
MKTRDDVCQVALALKWQRYADADVVFAAGSLVRGEGTPHSDLDLVVVYPRLRCAYRESFNFQALPVEAFVHDPETLAYFFREVDGRSGVPSLMQMVQEGVEVPEPTEESASLKRLALSVIEAGPPKWTAEDEARARYAITDLADDLRAARSRDELLATGTRLYEALATYYFRVEGHWSATAKAIPRALRRCDPRFATKFADAFAALFSAADQSQVVALAEEVLIPHGGWLFDGYRGEAPAEWRASTVGSAEIRTGGHPAITAVTDTPALVRHFLAAIAYRTQKALRDAPASFGSFEAGSQVRTPSELLRHMTGVLGYARTFFVGGPFRAESSPDMSATIARFHSVLADLARHLEAGTPLRGTTLERLLQGPLSDAMTHAGQLAILRRLAGSPVPPENFIEAAIDPANVGPSQPQPASPDLAWPEGPKET